MSESFRFEGVAGVGVALMVVCMILFIDGCVSVVREGVLFLDEEEEGSLIWGLARVVMISHGEGVTTCVRDVGNSGRFWQCSWSKSVIKTRTWTSPLCAECHFFDT